MNVIKQKNAKTHIANGYEDPLLAFVDIKPFEFEELTNRRDAPLDVNQNCRFVGEGNAAMHNLLTIFLKENNFKKIFPHDHVAFDFTLNRTDKVYVSVWHPTHGFIWQNKKQSNDISFIVKDNTSIVRAKYGTLWTDINGIKLGR